MDYRAIDFLNNFESETRSQIIEFGKQISSTKLQADVYIVMARKAICLIDLLIKFRLASLPGLVVSERILDMNTLWLKGKSVTIIDDALVSGTSIKRKVIDKLTEVGVKKIQVCVLAINKKWYNDDMLTDNTGKSYLAEPINIQEDEKCMRSCYDIVKAFSSVPTPYDIDFPFYDEDNINKVCGTITQDTINNWLNSSWLAINVTSTSRISNTYSKDKEMAKSVSSKFESITLYPPNNIIQKVWGIIGIECPNPCSLKMRTYIRKRKKDKEQVHVAFLPFAIIDSLTNKQIDIILKRLFPTNDMKAIINEWFITYSAKFRLIQFIAATILAKEFFADMELFDINSAVTIFPEFNESRAVYIFHEKTLPLFKNLKFNDEISYEQKDFNELESKQITNKNIPENTELDQVANVELCMEKMLDLFLQLYENQEKKARILAKNYGKRIFTNDEYKQTYDDVMKRLDRGYTIKQLIKPLSTLNNAEYIASMFLDYAIDIGIAVPITFTRNNTVSRAYRHGEDVIFADKEAKQLAFMLQVFSQDISTNNGIGAILTEKLLTTFIRIGLARGIFEKYDYNKIHEKTRDYLKIVYNLHGSTVRVFDSAQNKTDPLPYMTNDDTSKWLRDILIKKKLLKVNGTGDDERYFIPSEKENELILEHSISNEGAEAERIASTIAYFYKNKYLTTDDLILINATYGYEQIIPALLAEIEIIKTSYQKKERYFMSSNILKNHAMNSFKGLRNFNMFKAVNSGEWKYLNFEQDYASTKIRELLITDECERGMKLNWRQFWHEKISNVEEILPCEVKEMFDQIISFIIQFSIIFRLLEFLSFWNTLGPSGIEEYFLNLSNSIPKNTTNRSVKLKYIKNFNEDTKWSPVLSYFDICDFSINTSTINDEEKISKLKIGLQLLDIIQSKSEVFKRRINSKKLLEDELIDILDEVFVAKNYSHAIIERLFLQADYLVSNIEKVQKRASTYINARGKIEKPKLYRHVIIIEDINNAIARFNDVIIKKITHRKKKTKGSLDYSIMEKGIIIFFDGIDMEETLFNLAKEINIAINTESQFQITVLFNLGEYCCPIRHKESFSPINQKFFWSWYYTIKQKLEDIDSLFSIIQVTKKSPKITELTQKFKITKISIASDELEDKEVNVMYLDAQTNRNTILRKQGFNIGIITALDSELIGVKNAIEEKFDTKFIDELDHKENFRRNLIADFEYKNNTYKIILTKSGVGETEAANAYSSIAKYKLDYIFLCGIAGTCKESIKIGHVFIPFEIFSSILKKEIDDGTYQLRGESYKIQSNHIGLLEQFISSRNYDFQVSNDSAVSDNVVIANSNSRVLKKVKQFNSKIACIEMESVGIFSADYARGKSKYGVYMIRGVSDKANKEKNDDYHTLAINNASRVMSDLLEFIFDKNNIIKKMK